jgi:hopanoid C-3 methylase
MIKMKILLVQTATNPKVLGGDLIFRTEPLWAEYLASSVQETHDVEILDLRMGGDFQETLKNFQPNVIGLTAFTVDVNSVKRLLQDAKHFNPKILTVVGGYHASLSPEDFYDQSIDVIIRGEGIFTFKEVVEAFEKGNDFNFIKGIIFFNNSHPVQTVSRPWPHLDVYNFPNRTLTAQYREEYFDKWMKPLATIRGSYSCPFKCDFCCLWPMTNSKYLSRSPESFIAELKTIKEENIFFSDDEALIDIERMNKIAEMIDKEGIKKQYFFMTRSTSVRKRPDIIEKWAKVGLRRVLLGLESPRETDLIDFKKDATIYDNNQAISVLKQNNIEINSMFVITQDYDKKDFENLNEYVKKQELEMPIFCILTPFPGTILYTKTKDQIIVEDYDNWDLLHTVLPTTKLSLKEFYMEYAKLYGGLEPLYRGILRHRESVSAENTVENIRRVFRAMKKVGNPT